MKRENVRIFTKRVNRRGGNVVETLWTDKKNPGGEKGGEEEEEKKDGVYERRRRREEVGME